MYLVATEKKYYKEERTMTLVGYSYMIGYYWDSLTEGRLLYSSGFMYLSSDSK